MNSSTKTIIGCLVALSLLGLNLLVDKAYAQGNSATTDEPTTLDLSDQARFLKGLESRSSSEWNFATEPDNWKQESYQLSISNPDIRLIEQDKPNWRNTGDDADYSILVDVYHFSDLKK
jgi:hypothetical protein